MGNRLGTAIRDLLEAAVLAALLFLVLQFAVQNTIVEGSSMEPNFIDQQWLLVSKLSYRLQEPQRGDVIVFFAPEMPDKEFIKRIIGLPGERVEIRNGTVWIHGQALDEPWAPVMDATPFGPFTVPEGQYFVLGDNRPQSNDSRSWSGTGAGLARDRIVGKAWLSLWPRVTWGLVPADGPGPAVQSAGR
jgi:signal peptidase I